MPINIPLWQMKRANKAAIERLGERWSPAHDKFAARWLFKRGVISDFEKEAAFREDRRPKSPASKNRSKPRSFRVSGELLISTKQHG